MRNKIFTAIAVGYIVIGFVLRFTLPAYSANTCPLSCGDQDRTLSVEDAGTSRQIMRLKGPTGGALYVSPFSSTNFVFATSPISATSVLIVTGAAYLAGACLVPSGTAGTLVLADALNGVNTLDMIPLGTNATASDTHCFNFNPPVPYSTGIYASATNITNYTVIYTTQ